MSNVKTEGRHPAEFLVSEANGFRSRHTYTVKEGQKLVPGQIVQFDSGKLIAWANTGTAAAGIMWDHVDASATGANADVEGAVVVARHAEVKLSELTYPDETGADADATATLALLGIIAR